MMTNTTPKPIGLSSIILAQRCAGPYRASICKANDTNELQVSLEKINDQTLAYEPCCSLTGEEWCQAVDAMVQLTNAIPEAKRSLSVEHLIYCSEHRRAS